MFLGRKTEKNGFLFDGKILGSSKEKTVFGVTIDNKYALLTEYSSLKMEFFKIMHNLLCPIMDDIFAPCINNFNQGNFQEFGRERKKTSNMT